MCVMLSDGLCRIMFSDGLCVMLSDGLCVSCLVTVCVCHA